MSPSSIYPPALADMICARLASTESLRAICRDPEMPSHSTVMRWLSADEHSLRGILHGNEHERSHRGEETRGNGSTPGQD